MKYSKIKGFDYVDSFYTREELSRLGLKKIGKNVLISRYCRFYQPSKIIIGDNVRIDDFCILSGNIKLENFIHIAAYTALYGGDKGIYIRDFANISSRVMIYALSDDYSGNSMTNPMVPNDYKEIVCKPVNIKEHVLIGTGCTVLPGVELKIGSAFGAMTLINRDSEPWSINVGIPFKKVKNRRQDILRLEQLFREKSNKNITNNVSDG